MKWVMAVVVVAFLLSTFLMYEGRSTRRTPGRNADGSMTDYEVANINGRSLMRSELERRLRDYLSNYSSRSILSQDISELYQSVLNQVVLESQLAKEVEESGIRVSDADADRAMKDYADTYYPTREAFYQVLEQSGVKVDDYKRNLARQMAVEQLLSNAVGEIVISEDRATEFYDTMKTVLYSRPEGFNVHIADFRVSADAEALHTRLVEGDSWDVIVSNDELASQDIINITKTPIFLPASTFRTGALSVLASLDVGQPSEVFSMSSTDYAVALKTSHVEATITPYEEVSGDIRTMLTNQEERRRLTDYQTSLREKAQVVINDEELFARPAVSEDSELDELVPGIVIEEVSEDTPSIVIEDEDTDEPESEAEVVPESPDEPEVEPVEDTPTPEPEVEAEPVVPTEETPEPEAQTEETEQTPESEPEQTVEEPDSTPVVEDVIETAEEIITSSDAE